VPPGTYGDFAVSGHSGLVIGVAGAVQPASYNLRNLCLAPNSTVEVVGPVILTTANGFFVNGSVGNSNNPAWLQLNIACGDLTLNCGSIVYAQVAAPSGRVTVEGNSTLIGTSVSADFDLNDNGLVRWGGNPQAQVLPPAASNQTIVLAENGTTNITLTGSDPQNLPLTYSVLTQPTHGTLSGSAPNLVYAPAANFYGSDAFTFQVNDGVNNSAAATVGITVQAVDEPPIVSAGSNQLIALPNNTVNLSGTVTYAPFLNTVDSVLWSQAGGPGTVSFGDAANTATTATFSTNGVYVLQLYASDSFLSASNSLTVTVDAPPVVIAGPRQTVNFGTVVTLAGIATDDQLPYNVLNSGWVQMSGPGTAAFANPTLTNTTVTFDQPGIYDLGLEADDGFATNSADVVIQVHAVPTVFTGTNQVVAVGTSATLDGSFVDDGLAGVATSEWIQVSGPALAVIADAASTNTTASFSADGLYAFDLTVTDGLTNASAPVTITAVAPPGVGLASSALVINWPNQVTLNGTVSADGLPSGGTLTATWSQASGPAAAVLSNPLESQSLNGTPVSLPSSTVATFSTPGVYEFQLAASNQVGSAESNIVVTVNQPPVVNAGVAQTNLFPAAVQLSGTVTDDGLPLGGSLTLSWSVVSGPGTVGFNDATLTNATATFSQPGIYVLQLTAGDSAAVSSSQVVIVEDTAPSVTLATNQVPAGTNRVVLTGTVTDDGLPSGAELTANWSLASGPSAVVFNPAVQTSSLTGSPVTNIVQSTVTFSVAGTYAISLTANDSIATSFATISLSVASTPPIVDAGPDMYLSGVPAIATLNGQVSDAVLPQGGTLSQQWNVVAGPGTVTFDSPMSPVTTATFSTNGIYVLQLTASNGQSQSSRMVEVRVETICTVEDPVGLAAWWPANANAEDVISGQQAIPNGAGYASGEVGQAFNFNGTDSVRVPGATNYNVGASPAGMTIEFWMNPNSFQLGSVLGWANSIRVERENLNWIGSALRCYLGTGGQYIQTPGNVWNNTAWGWTHVAVTYDRSSGMADLYINGSIQTSANVGTNLMTTANDIYMGQVPGSPNFFSGELDEISLYERPLNPEEVYNIYASGSVGKCPNDTNAPPSVSAGPDLFLSGVPATATLNGQVIDAVLPPGGTLSEQWNVIEGPGSVTFGNPAAAVTTATFSTNGIYVLQLTANNGESQAGSLVEVRVETLCTVQDPVGLAAWWPGDGSAEEVISGNSGILGGSTSYANGEVGLAFKFDGADDFVDVPAATNYNVGSSPAGMTIEFWMNPNSFQVGSVLGWANSIRVERVNLNWIGSALRCYLGTSGQYVQTPGNVWNNTAWGWTHVAVTYDRSSGIADLYINGSIQASANVGTNLMTTANDFYMGQVPGSPNFFSGELDEISLYQRPLNPEEVYDIYASGSVGKCPDTNTLAVNAGQNISISAPTNTALLSGTVTENGQPAGIDVQMQWTELSGPETVVFGNPTSANSLVSFSTNGIYILQLIANNGDEVSSGLVEVRVGVPCDDLDLSGLSAWWPANGTARELIGGNEAILGGSTGYANGEVALAFNFDGGDDFIWAPASTNYNVGPSPSGITIEFWMKPNSLQQGSVLGWANSIRVERQNFNWIGSALRCYLGTSGQYVQTPGNVWNNTAWGWTHVAITYNKTNGIANIYINGSIQASANVGGSLMNTATDFYMGQVPGSANFYSGQLDEITLYSRPLSAAEIAAIYAAGSAGKCPDDLNP
jgi:hypothetical protein